MDESNEWHARISHAFAVHARDERYVLDRYEELARVVTDPGTRFLIDLIVEDEHRHHGFFERLRSSAAVTPGQDDQIVPLPPRPDLAQVPALLENTRRFREAEEGDVETLRQLEHELRSVDDERLWHLLVVVMQLDTEKHLRILRYLERRLEEELDAASG